MASELPVLKDDYGRPIHVGRTQEGAVGINVRDGMASVLAVLSGERLAAFREAVDREAMQGQSPAPAAPATEPADGTIQVRTVTLWLCDLCLDGAGGECHTPGCSLWFHRAPDTPVRGSQGVTVHDGVAPDVPGQPATGAP